MFFTSAELSAYIGAQLAAHGIEMADDGPTHIIVHVQSNAISFRGRLPEMRKEHQFLMPYHQIKPDVISAKSILTGPNLQKMQWMVNGQALRGCKEVIHIGSVSNNSITLHGSMQHIQMRLSALEHAAPADRKADIRDYNHTEMARLEKTGLYGDVVCIGRYVDKGGPTLELELTPVFEQPEFQPVSLAP